jgi:hypothetical protein
MGIGHEFWEVEGNEPAEARSMYNIKVHIKEYDGEASICLRTVRVSGLYKCFMKFWLNTEWEIS